jgi:hypothetical protein
MHWIVIGILAAGVAAAFPLDYSVSDREIPATGGCATTWTGTAPAAFVALAEFRDSEPPFRYASGDSFATCADPLPLA